MCFSDLNTCTLPHTRLAGKVIASHSTSQLMECATFCSEILGCEVGVFGNHECVGLRSVDNSEEVPGFFSVFVTKCPSCTGTTTHSTDTLTAPVAPTDMPSDDAVAGLVSASSVVVLLGLSLSAVYFQKVAKKKAKAQDGLKQHTQESLELDAEAQEDYENGFHS